jgi:hypothetical protein
MKNCIIGNVHLIQLRNQVQSIFLFFRLDTKFRSTALDKNVPQESFLLLLRKLFSMFSFKRR